MITFLQTELESEYKNYNVKFEVSLNYNISAYFSIFNINIYLHIVKWKKHMITLSCLYCKWFEKQLLHYNSTQSDHSDFRKSCNHTASAVIMTAPYCNLLRSLKIHKPNLVTFKLQCGQSALKIRYEHKPDCFLAEQSIRQRPTPAATFWAV